MTFLDRDVMCVLNKIWEVFIDTTGRVLSISAQYEGGNMNITKGTSTFGPRGLVKGDSS